jgi:ADP-heptose:LPS heptosyltransferase
MHVRFTQIVDRWFGVPLCTMCMLYDRLLRLLPRSNTGGTQRVLFIELSEMGSTFLAYPAIQELLSSGVEPSDVYFLIFESNAESVHLLNCLPEENILTIADSSFPRFILSTVRCVGTLRRLRFGTIFDLELFSRFTSLISYAAGAPMRAGFSNFTEEGLYRGDLLTHPVWYNPFVHIAQNFIHLVRSVLAQQAEAPSPKIPVADFPFDIVPQFESHSALAQRIRFRLDELLGHDTSLLRLLVVNPDPGQLPLRGWPVERYAAVLQRLHDEMSDVCIVVCGMKSSGAFAEKLHAIAPIERFINFCGETRNLRELTELLALADGFLTSDSGPGHMVTLTNTPALVLFGPEAPGRYRPLGARIEVGYAQLACSPCYTAANHRHSACTRNECMQQISTEQVYQTMRRMLQE